MKALIKEFKEFISRGNVMDMAVGVIIGGAFTAIVNSLVNDMLMPLLSLLTGGFDFSGLCIALGEGENAATINKVSRKKKEETPAPTTKECPYCKEQIAIDATRCPHCTSELQ